MYSAYLAKDWIRQSPFIMMNGDVFLDSSIIRKCWKTTNRIWSASIKAGTWKSR